MKQKVALSGCLRIRLGKNIAEKQSIEALLLWKRGTLRQEVLV